MENIILDIEDSAEGSPSADRLLEHPHKDIFLPIPYHLRFTFSNQDKELTCLNSKSFISRCKLIHTTLVQKLIPYMHRQQYTSGFEVRNKAGDNCKAHIHVCFKSTDIKNTIDKAIKRHLVDVYDEDVVGNKCKMFKEWTQLRDENEYWRYPIKQTYDPLKCGGFSKSFLETQHEIAKTSYAKTVQVNQSKMDKRDNSDTLFLRVMNKMTKAPIQPTNPRQIASYFVQFYIDEDRPLNKTVIQGYVTLAAVKLQLKTQDALLDEWGY